MLSINLIDSNSRASSILDFLRFLSALIVFLFHFYVPLPGYQAVMIFFVLSGYFISSTVLKSVTENRWSWSDYLIKRITRLWVVLIPCLFLTLVWANFQLHLFGKNEKLLNVLNLETLIGNLFFLQGILVKPYGLNGPLWSLSYEFWYYIMFPCLVLTIKAKKIRLKVFYAFLLISISFLVGQRITIYFLVWLLGAIIPLINPLKISNKYASYTILTVVTLIAILSTQYSTIGWSVSWYSFGHDLSVGLSFSILIYIVISFYNVKRNSKTNIPNHLASISYTLYLAHYPIANFVMVWLVSPLWPFEYTTLTIKLSIAMFVLLYSWLVAKLTERHTSKVRLKVSQFFNLMRLQLKNKQKTFSNRTN
ncbi:acyltransferase [Neobacillus niacini]|uniref:acyltransferase family protein n=1 Tax=Neobacillus niacini TaxID=86668 RepID=UPI002857D8FD|nr:acyltransferase [Neobacillus niacini]MDR7000618.1 peptidoglycan/LPS O-acetylase OafA/YrhL [Neobacillus niacini]